MAENKDNTCSICLETIMFPTVLDCGHIFCFLCVKGIAFKSRKCALCRADIPLNFLDNPKLLQTAEELEKNEEENETQYKWFYEGRNGWWAFESRTNSEIEEAYSNGKKNCVVLIAGYCYIIDFENMMQLRQNQPSKHRKIKRDLATAPKKGIAGIRLSNPETLEVKTDAGHSDNLTQNSDISDASTAILDISDTTTATFDFSDHDEIQLSQELSETLSIIDITEEQ